MAKRLLTTASADGAGGSTLRREVGERGDEIVDAFKAERSLSGIETSILTTTLQRLFGESYANQPEQGSLVLWKDGIAPDGFENAKFVRYNRDFSWGLQDAGSPIVVRSVQEGDDPQGRAEKGLSFDQIQMIEGFGPRQ